jgi:fibronectin-binding autotransporter adhesin
MMKKYYNVFIICSFFIFIAAFSQTSYYSYQTGDWETADTWTTDPSGTTLQNPAVPGSSDDITILDGRTVTVTSGSKTVTATVIEAGAILDLQDITGHDLGTVSGGGKLRIDGVAFPSGTFTDFFSSSGGTVEFYDYSNGNNLPASIGTMNNLEITNSTVTNRIDLTHQLTLNGYLTINSGQLRLDSRGDTLFIGTDLTIESDGRMFVDADFGSGNPIYYLVIGGNMTNNGVFDMTESAQYASTDDCAEVIFTGTADNVLTGTGSQTDFYKLIIDKGSDQTYILDCDVSNFALYGPTNQNNVPDGSTNPNETNPVINKALWIKNGTCKLEAGIDIEELSSGGDDFYIPLNGCLWINGADVAATRAGTGDRAITIIGKFRISDGSYSGTTGGGFIYRLTGEIVIEGGYVNLSQLRSSVSATYHRESFSQSGGTVLIRGNYGEAGEVSGGYSLFSCPYTDNVFAMSGGTLAIRDVSAAPGTYAYNAVEIGCDESNINVTGGTLALQLQGNDDFVVSSTAPFYNVNITEQAGGTGVVYVDDSGGNYPLEVLNDLSIGSGTGLDANDHDVMVGGDFTVDAAYTYGTNTTTFNSTYNNQLITLNTAQNFNNFIVNNIGPAGNDTVKFAGTESSTTIVSDLTITDGILYDNGYTITVNGDVANSGEHASSGSGSMVLSGGSSAHTISGDGSGIFGSLELDDANGVTCTADQAVNDALTLTAGVFDIDTYNLTLNTGASIGGTITSSNMIETAGNRSDGGLSKTYSGSGSFTFPFGTGGIYTPAMINVGSASSYGTITARPVAEEHPNVTAFDSSLTYYWRVTSSGFTSPSDVTHNYTYNNADIPGGNDTTSYLPGHYDQSTITWTAGVADDVDGNLIRFNNVSYIDGEFTAGYPEAFGSITIYYSRQTGDWDDTDTWSTTSHSGSAASQVPESNSPVIVGDADVVTITGNNIICGSLRINENSTLDVGTYTGHNFGAVVSGEGVTGKGTLQISAGGGTAQFPGGDFGDFLSDGGGTVEYYGTSSYTLPASPTGYNNLTFSSAGSAVFTMPDADLTIYNDLSVNSGTAQLSNATNGDLVIYGDIDVTGGTLQYPTGTVRDISLASDLTIGSSGSFQVSPSGTVTHTMTAEGSIANNGTFNMYDNTGSSLCNVTFEGTGNESITGTGSTMDFNRLIVNKGTSQTAVLEVNQANFDLLAASGGATKALEVQNGTIRLTSAQDITLSSGGSDYSIPSTGCIEINGATTSITGSGLLLSGTLTVSADTLDIAEYIEYSATGTAELEVSGGVLDAGYQIRRSATSTTGVLDYVQSGGTVIVGSSGGPTSTRGMFEILNSGSSMNMSGGTLVVVRAQTGTPSIASLYLHPASGSITAGTIQIGNASTPASEDITINSNSSIYNLTIDNTSTNNPTATLNVNALAVLNDMTLASGTTFNSAGLNLSVGGDFNDSGTYTSGSNTTTFNSNAGSQTITLNNTATFYNLTINNSSAAGSDSVILSGSESATTVNNILTITDGVFADGGKTVTVLGNMVNSSTHSSSASGKIVMGGSAAQTISGSGNGVFGTLEIDNTANVLTSAMMTINDSLIFTDGLLNIGSNQLILGSSFNYSGTPSSSSMIRTSGSLSDNGVTKNFSATPASFTFPIGSVSKYTPATYNISSISAAGTITVRPVNSEHPSTTDATADSALDYYWRVRSTGFSGGLTLTHVYQYVQADVDGDEAQYEGARLSGTAWNHDGTVNTGTNEITFNNYPINCDYTAGDTVEFGIIPSYRSITTGDWDVAGTWDIGVPAAGAIVIISPGDVVTISSNSKLTTVMGDSGTLVLGTTYGHNFNTVSGNGTLQLSSGTFPGGDFTDFFSSSGGTVEYTGAGSYTLSNRNSYNNLVLSGSGTKTFANTDLTINGALTISSGTANGTVNNPDFSVSDSAGNGGTFSLGSGVFTIGDSWTNTGTFSLNSGTMNLSGNWTNTGTFNSNTGSVSFVGGSSAQTISGSGTDSFYNLTVNMSGNQLALNKSITVSHQLNLMSRNIVTGSDSVTLSASATYTGGSSSSYISGKLTRIFNNNSSIEVLTYPTGKGGHYLPVDLGIQLNAATSTPFSVEQFNSGLPSYSYGSGVYGVSQYRYWHVTRSSGATVSNARITIRWDGQDKVSDLADLIVAHDRELGSTWYSEEGTNATGDSLSGSVTSNLNFTSMGDFILGSGSEDNPLPVEMDESSVKLVATRAGIEINWETMSEYENASWRIKRRTIDEDWRVIDEFKGQGNSSEGAVYKITDRKAKVNNVYEYMIADVSYNGIETDHGPYEIIYEIPYDFKLHQNYPNPFNPTTRINFDLSKNGRVTIMIYNVLGQKVKTVYENEYFEAGYKSVLWNGRNDHGVEVASGMYILRVIYRMPAKNKVFVEMKKMIMIK